jgi:hypothetical protein
MTSDGKETAMRRSTNGGARGRVLLTALLASSFVLTVVPSARGLDPAYRPDGWIKLCGINIGCAIDPPPHPWRGKDVYNTTGRRQTVRVDLNDGQGVRFWITLQNDGGAPDTFTVQGCSGNRVFEVNRVLLGKHKRQDPSAEDLKRRYIRGTLTFDLDAGETVVFTLNMLSNAIEGRTYRCRTEFTSTNDADARDVVVAEMTTY